MARGKYAEHRSKFKPKTPCVYRLVHVPTGAQYLGSTKRCARDRVGAHFSMINRKVHPAPKLQALWNASSPSEWVSEPLEYGTAEGIRALEDIWFAKGGSFLNCAEGSHISYRPVSMETRAKQRAARLKFIAENPGEREKLAAQAKAQQQDPEHRRKLRAGREYFQSNKTDFDRARHRAGVRAFFNSLTPEERRAKMARVKPLAKDQD